MVPVFNLPAIDVAETGKNIKSMMDSNGISVRELQEVLGFNTPAAIYKWIWGKNLPAVDNLAVLAWFFGTSIDQIIVIDFPEDEWKGCKYYKEKIVGRCE